MSNGFGLDLGPVSAYALAKKHGYTGTEEQWAQEQAEAGKNAANAKKSEQSAVEAANRAEQAANQAADKLALAGGTMRGALDMGQQPLQNVPSPVNPSDATNKGFVENCVTAEEVARKKEIAVERARIDNLVATPPSATEGNAELLDIRIDNNGHTHATAGEAVRSQIKNIEVQVSENTSSRYETNDFASSKCGINKFNSRCQYKDNTGLTKAGLEYSKSFSIATEHLSGLVPGNTYIFEGANNIVVVFYNCKKEVISGELMTNFGVITAPQGTCTFRISGIKYDVLDYLRIFSGDKHVGDFVPYNRYAPSEPISNLEPMCKKGGNVVVSVRFGLDKVKEAILNGKNAGMNSIALLVSNGVQNKTSSVFDPMNDNVKAVLPEAVKYCNELGMFCHLRCTFFGKDGTGSSSLEPADMTSFITNWEALVRQFIDVVWPLNVRTVSIANESRYIVTEENRQHWKGMVDNLHKSYNGIKIGVNFNIYEYEYAKPVFDVFDIVGFNFYPCLTKKGLAVSDSVLAHRFFNDLDGNNLMNVIRDFKRLHADRKFWITEVGTQDQKEGLFDTWANVYNPSIINEEAQYRYYKLWMRMLYEKTTLIDGIFIWALWDGGKSPNNGFNPIGKKAESVIKKYWGNN